VTDAAPAVISGADSIFRTGDVVGDAWSWLVMREALLYGVCRFGEFQARLGVPRSTLSARLSQLDAAGLIARQASGPAYEVTESGRDFIGCLMVAMRWGDRWYFHPGDRPQPVTHLGCGQSLDAVLACGACGNVLHARDVTAERAGVGAKPPRRVGGLTRRKPDLDLLERNRTCSIARTLSATGDWWSGLVIRECFFGTRRFDDFQRRLDIAPNILSGRLRRLVELGILTKVEYEAWPIRHEYRLTERGLDLYHVPLAMLAWGRRWLQAASSDAHLTHTPCGEGVEAVLTCAGCGEPIVREDIALTTDPVFSDLSTAVSVARRTRARLP
jgi:DNA-binding HxlR family transcriptional regulator